MRRGWSSPRPPGHDKLGCPEPAAILRGYLWIIKTLFPSDSDNSVLILGSNRAKDGALSPRLANRYSRFALSHSSCYYDSHRVREWEQRVERSQLPQLRRALSSTETWSPLPALPPGLMLRWSLHSLLRGDPIAQEIQLSIQYAPNPVLHSGAPDTAPAEVLRTFNESYSAVAASREAEARRFAAILGVAI